MEPHHGENTYITIWTEDWEQKSENQWEWEIVWYILYDKVQSMQEEEGDWCSRESMKEEED